jgi:ribosome-associated toxin RatA of RatAB toxin-antitoxin module
VRQVRRSALVPYEAAEMYALVNDVEAYPSFIAWCRGATVRTHGPELMEATLEIAQGGFAGAFTTRNRLQPGRAIDVHLLDGPFRLLEGRWDFDPLDGAASRVAVAMRYDFANPFAGLLFGRMVEDVVSALVDAFVRRAREIYGHR